MNAFTFLIALAVFVSSSHAAAVNAVCSIVNNLVTKAKAQGPATAFCSSYLSIPVRTASLTTTITSGVSTVTSVTGTTATTEIISTSTSLSVLEITTTPTITVTAITGSTVTVYTATTTPCYIKESTPAVDIKRELEQRAATTVAKPPCLSTFPAGALLSSACKCLAIPTSTTTKTSTTTVPHITTIKIISTNVVKAVATAQQTTTIFVPGPEPATITITSSADTTVSALATAKVGDIFLFGSGHYLNYGHPNIPGSPPAAFIDSQQLNSNRLFLEYETCRLYWAYFGDPHYAVATPDHSVYFEYASNIGDSKVLTCRVKDGNFQLLCQLDPNDTPSSGSVQSDQFGQAFWHMDPQTNDPDFFVKADLLYGITVD